MTFQFLKCESHPYLVQDKLIEFCRNHSIILEAYSPFARGKVLEDKTLKEIAEKQPPPKDNKTADAEAPSRAERLFGLQLQDLTPELTQALGYTVRKGVLISGVEPDSPADSVGMQRGLVIYRIGRYNVNSVKQVESILSRAESGTSVDFTVGIGRGQRFQTVTMAAR